MKHFPGSEWCDILSGVKRLYVAGAVALIAVYVFIAARSTGVLPAEAKTIENFTHAYVNADESERQRLSESYLEDFSSKELLAAQEHAFKICHFQAHPFGRAVYKKEQNFAGAIAQCGNSCNSGCFHGVLMEMFKTDSDNFGGLIEDEDPVAYLESITDDAKRLCASPELDGLVMPVFCQHGLGHVFAYVSDYNIKAALRSCTEMGPGFRSTACAGGAYMEYMGSTTDTAKFTKKDFFPCDKVQQYSQHCYRYKGKFMAEGWGGLKEAMEACATLSERRKIDCTRGVAFWTVTVEDLARENGLDAVCGTITDTKQHAECEYGAISYVVLSTDSATNEACERMSPQYQNECIEQFDLQRSYKF